MSRMSQKKGVRLKPKQRQGIIEEGLRLGLTQQQIADRCGVSRQTITRQIRRWRESGGFEEWLFDTWMRLFGRIEEEDVKLAFNNVTRLLEKFMRRRIDLDVNAPRPIILKTWRPEK